MTGRRLLVVRVAGGAVAEEGEVLDTGREVVAGRDGVAEGLNQGVVQVEDGAAAVANQVVMPRFPQKFELADAVPEVGLGHEPGVAKSLQGPIDGRAGDGGHADLDPGEDLVGREVAPLFPRLQDDESLGRHPMPGPP